MAMTQPAAVQAWHAFVTDPTPAGLRALLADDAVFRSPAVHTPQEGAELTYAYLWAAVQVLGPTLVYRHEWYDEHSAVLRFNATVDGLEVDGVDIITWNEDDKITEFAVMTRPFKGLQALIHAMGAALSHR